MFASPKFFILASDGKPANMMGKLTKMPEINVPRLNHSLYKIISKDLLINNPKLYYYILYYQS